VNPPRCSGRCRADRAEQKARGLFDNPCGQFALDFLDGNPLAAQPPPAGEVIAWADADTLDQILDNLIDNAVKYTPAAGRICVRWRADGPDVYLEVEDTGVGIPEPDLPRVFERFYRVDKARSRELGGTGLGLSIVKHLTQSMGGGVSAASTLGRGTTFTVRLPRPPAE
jgi:two-component system phosphate regulon sensor histidine kinase PhoR